MGQIMNMEYVRANDRLHAGEVSLGPEALAPILGTWYNADTTLQDRRLETALARLPGAYLAGVPIRIHTRHHAGPLPWTHRAPWGRFYDRFNNALSSDELLGPVEARPAA